MAKQLKPKAEITGIDLSFNVRYRNPEDPESPELFFRDDVFVNFKDEQSLNRIVAEKPYLQDIIPILAAKFTKHIAEENKAGSELKSKIAEMLSA